MALALSRPGSCRRLVSDLVRTLQRKKRSVIGRTRDWGLVSAAAPASPPPASSGGWSQQRWKLPGIKPSLASYRPHEPLMRLMAGSRAWHGGASAGSVRGVASAPLSAAESEVERGPTTIHPTAVVEPGAIVGDLMAWKAGHHYWTEDGLLPWVPGMTPEHLHTPGRPAEKVRPELVNRLHSSLSAQTGSNCGPMRSHRPDGIGFLLHIESRGTVPTETRDALNSS